MGASRINTKAILLTVAFALLAILVVNVGVPIVGIWMTVKPTVDRAQRGRERLFYQTDYAQLLAACRALSQRSVDGDLKPGNYHVHLGDPAPESQTFPQVILDLEPGIVQIESEGKVWLELLPGPEYFGVFAYPEGQKDRGDVKLIDGLWYYDSDYRDAYPEYMKKIDTMIADGRKRKSGGQLTSADQP